MWFMLIKNIENIVKKTKQNKPFTCHPWRQVKLFVLAGLLWAGWDGAGVLVSLAVSAVNDP